MKNYYVYWWRETHHTDPFTEGYVGVTGQSDPKRRQQAHRRHSAWWHEDLVMDVLYENLEESEAYGIEVEYRPKYNIGFNIASGGKWSGERGEPSPAWNKGLKGYFTMSDEAKKMISKAMTGVKKTAEHAKNISKGLTGIKQSPEHKAKSVKNLIAGNELYDIDYVTTKVKEVNELMEKGMKLMESLREAGIKKHQFYRWRRRAYRGF